MRYVRWLGAYRKGAASVEEAARWETTQQEREVAVEPLQRGWSAVLDENSRVEIGLEVCVETSRFVAGFYTDCWSEVQQSTGRLVCYRKPDERREWAFAKKLAKVKNGVDHHHAEAWFAEPRYKAVVVYGGATKQVRRRASQLAKQLGLPLVSH